MEITLLHSLAYMTEGNVPVSVVAKSLLANERLIQESVRLLENLSLDIRVASISVSVRHLSNESPLKELLAVAIYMTFQTDLEKQVPALIEQMAGVPVPEDAQALITVLVLITAVYLVDATIERLFPGKSLGKLKAEYERLKDIAAGITKVSPGDLDAAIRQRFEAGRAKTLVQRALDFFAPARLDPQATIQGTGEVYIGRPAIEEVPGTIDYAILEQKVSYELQAVNVEIHRADTDENKHGWRAVIRDVSDRKVRMELDTSISPADLFGVRSLIGDVTVIQEMQTEGDYEVKAYHLMRVHTKNLTA